MSKYSNEFKLEVVKYCIEGHHGFKSTADYFNIPAKVTVQKWCRKYQAHGEKGLLKNLKTSYSGELFYMKEYKTIEELEKDIIEYIDYYNSKRIKSKLKGMSPVQYRTHS